MIQELRGAEADARGILGLMIFIRSFRNSTHQLPITEYTRWQT